MKKLLILAVMMLTTMTVSAQMHAGQWGVMPKAGFNLAKITDLDDASMKVGLVAGADLIYHDCTYAACDADRAKKHFHSTATDAARTALDAGAARLMLGHFSARYPDETILLDEACQIFSNTLLAKENLTVSI